MIWLYLKKTDFWPFLVLFWSILGPKMKNFRNSYKSCYHLAISFSTMYDSTIFKENPFLTLFLVLFYAIFGHFGSKNSIFQFPFQKLRSPCQKLSNGIWYDYIKIKLDFATFWSFFGLFWSNLGQKMKNSKQICKMYDLLAICFPTIYDMTTFEENRFLTLFLVLF